MHPFSPVFWSFQEVEKGCIGNEWVKCEFIFAASSTIFCGILSGYITLLKSQFLITLIIFTVSATGMSKSMFF